MRGKLALFLAIILALSLQTGVAAAHYLEEGSVQPSERWYTLVPGDEKNWNTLVKHMGLTWDDAVRYILQWNPEVKNPYDLKVGQQLRIPGQSTYPAYPPHTGDFSKWVVIGTHTSTFWGSPAYRVHNIVTAGNAINNWFGDARHPYVMPRDSLSMNWLLGAPYPDKGYQLGKAIGRAADGSLVDIYAWGGGICQVPSTIFPALLKAGLDVLERQNHSYYPYWWWRYPEGFGWDATTGAPYDPDLVFRNMYDYPVRLWLTADTENYTLRVDVYAPPELVKYGVDLGGGPHMVTGPGKSIPISELKGAVKHAAKTFVTQVVDVGGSSWSRTFRSSYQTAPHP